MMRLFRKREDQNEKLLRKIEPEEGLKESNGEN